MKIRSPISVGAFSVSKPFFDPDSDILSFGLSKHWAHGLGPVPVWRACQETVPTVGRPRLAFPPWSPEQLPRPFCFGTWGDVPGRCWPPSAHGSGAVRTFGLRSAVGFVSGVSRSHVRSPEYFLQPGFPPLGQSHLCLGTSVEQSQDCGT